MNSNADAAKLFRPKTLKKNGTIYLNMRRLIQFLFTLGFAVSALLASNKMPNIVLIMADDVGLGDIGRHHTEHTGRAPLAPTPTIDALADAGMWFTDAHSPTSLCSPSRYAVMTGNYNFRSYAPWGVWGTFRPSAITTKDATLGTIAKKAGYTTGFIGKWHLGGDFYKKGSRDIYRGNDRGDVPLDVDMRKWIANGPQDLGFDYDYTLPTGVQGPVYLAFENGKWAPLSTQSKIIHYNKSSALDPIFVSDKGPGPGDSQWDSYRINQVLANKAVAFIESAARQKEPFFLCYWSPAVHIPHTPPEHLEGTAIRGTTPTAHTDMNRVVDWEVQKIVAALKSTGEYENTLIIFTSDNGGLYDKEAQLAGHTSNGGHITGTKNMAEEGGHLVPLIVTWPNVVQAGSRNGALVNGTDILATIASVTQVKLNKYQAMDSHNLLGSILNTSNYKPRKETLLQSGSTYQVMLRQGKWKLIMQTDYLLKSYTAVGLYNLSVNSYENAATNLVHDPKHTERLQTMIKRYHEIRNSRERTVER